MPSPEQNESSLSGTTIVAQYTDIVNRPPNLDDILLILGRHNLPWLEDRLAGSERVPEHRETMPGSTAFGPQYLADVYRTPLFYRLAFLRQLSTVALATHLEATHTRLSHALGTAEMASRMLERIRARLPADHDEETADLYPLYEKACLFWCFIHDAFHGPMGHSLDIMRDAFGISLEQKIDDAQFDHALRAAREDPTDPIGAQLRLGAECVAPAQRDELLDAVATLVDPAKLHGRLSRFFFFRDIVTSTLDADRLDYLIRDAELLTRARLGEDFQRLAGGVAAVEEEGLTRLAYADEHREIVVEALSTRRDLYARFYEHPQKLILDDMLCHGVYYVLSEKGLTGQSGVADPPKREQAIREFLLLSDNDVFPVLAEMRASPAAYDLITRVLQRRYYVAIADHGVSYESVERTLEEVGAWMDAISEEVARLVEIRSSRREKEGKYASVARAEDAEEFERVTGEFFAEREEEEDEILFFAFQRLSGGSFLSRVALEKSIWDRFCRDHDGDEDLRVRYIASEREAAFGNAGSPDEKERLLREELRRLDRYPPVHLSMSSASFKVESREDLEWYIKEGGPEEPVLFWREGSDGSIEAVRDRVEARIEHARAHFPVLVAVPRALAEIAGGQVLEAVREELRSCEWLWGRLAEGYEIPRTESAAELPRPADDGE